MEKDTAMFFSNLDNSVSEGEYDKIEQIFDTLNATSRLTNASMFVIDFYRNELIYKTDRLFYADVAEATDIQRESSNPYWALISDADFVILLKTRDAYLHLIESFCYEQKANHTYVIDYRIYLKGHPYIITQKFAPLKLTSNGKLWLGLFYITSSPHQDCSYITVFGDNFRYIYDFQRNTFLPYTNSLPKLSPMEKAIILRASKGSTTEEIAADLFKSVNTIKTHKRRLFNKLKVRSIEEALAIVSNYDLY